MIRNRYWVTGLVLLILLACGVAYCLMRKPLTVYDGLDPIVRAQLSPSAWDLFKNSAKSHAYFRPLRLTQIKLVYDLSGGHLFIAYAGAQIALSVLAMVLLNVFLAPTTRAGLAAVSVAGVVFLGLHTSRVLFTEAYPLNHFLEIVFLLLVGLVAARRLTGWTADLLAVGAVVVALLTLESGVLVWLAIVTAWIVGWRGVSRRGLVAVVTCLFLYAAARMFYLGLSTPGLEERSSGFGFVVLDPEALIARFGRNPLPFYVYNIVSSWCTVLLSEPRDGVWRFAKQWLGGDVPPFMWINVLTSVFTTALITGVTGRGLVKWRRAGLDDDTRVLLLFWVVLGANGAISYAYTKDVIMAPAGMMYAAAAFVAVRHMLRAKTDLPARLAVVALCVLLSVGWTWRTSSLFWSLKYQAYEQATEWAFVDDAMSAWSPELRENPQVQQLVERLRSEMVAKSTPTPRLWLTRRLQRWTGVGY